MTESDVALHDEQVLNCELPDAALELAGSKCWDGPASSFTVSFLLGNRYLSLVSCALVGGAVTAADSLSAAVHVGSKSAS